VCLVSELSLSKSRCADIEGRPIALFRTAGTSKQQKQSGPDDDADARSGSGCRLPDGSFVWAMDRVCYHMGGPLELGDLEDLGLPGGPVVRCPWHSYRIGLADGAGLYQQTPGQWKSKGIRQRVHAVRVVPLTAGDGSTAALQLQVRLLTAGGEVASDEYNAPAKYRALQERLQRAPQNLTLNTASWKPPQQQPHPYLQHHHPPGALLGGAAPQGYVRSGHVFAANRANAAATGAASSGTHGRPAASSSKGAGGQ
jgi:nitrite reductase/ring-hydroxylating ferredoxin subunit